MPNEPKELVLRLRSGWGSARQRRLGSAVVLLCIVPLLAGCMAALQQNAPGAVTRPAVLPSPTQAAPADTPAAIASRPDQRGSFAPDPATATPSEVSVPPQAPASTAALPATPLPPLSLPTQAATTNEERWRARQIERRPFEAPRPYFTTGSELWWYDPINQQSVILGRITGNFLGQAEFVLRGQGVAALEVPYQVNQSYGLTALSPAVIERIRAAGYTDWIETYVFLTPDVTPR